MASYTMELRELVSISKGIPDDGYKASWPMLGLSTYPIYDENHRRDLNYKIIRRFFMREIGSESFDMFQLNMDETMNRIMPGYNKLYLASILDIQHFAGVTRSVAEDLARNLSGDGTRTMDHVDSLIRDLTSEGSGTANSKTVSANTSDGHDTTKVTGNSNTTTQNLDTPQNQISNIEDGYLTSVQKENADSTQTTDATTHREDNGTDTTNADSTTHGTTNQTDKGSASENERTNRTEAETNNRKLAEVLTDPDQISKLIGYSRNLLNIDRMVVEDRELARCFMGVFL